MTEKDLVSKLSEKLDEALNDQAVLNEIWITNGTSDVETLYDLIGGRRYRIFKDTAEWNPNKGMVIDIMGGMVPGIVLRSEGSGENRIYIEVKETAPLTYGKEDSQITRYLLHLLAMTTDKPKKCPDDIRRAVLLAAPSQWFDEPRNDEVWEYFLETYRGLASAFNVTLGEIRLDWRWSGSV
ncbi:MAG: hypothetical protein LAO21_22495 [Acidobacteriia bacterium]|nr:hypothetical protein [Terriglobia bacterium]